MRGKKGFTLTELAIVIVLMGIIAAIMIPSLGGISEKSSETKAVETVKALIAEYEANNTHSTVQEVVIVNDTDSAFRVFGYNFAEHILYMFTGPTWLKSCSGASTNEQKFNETVDNLLRSADNSKLPVGVTAKYPDANGLVTITTQGNIINNMIDTLSEKTQKKYAGNTFMCEGEIADVMNGDNEYTCTDNGVVYYVVYAEPDKVSEGVLVNTYKTIFKDSDGTVLHTFATRVNTDVYTRFTCPDDPTHSGKYFRYWELVKVNDTTMSTPATALVAGEKYDIPNSDVVYKAVYSDSKQPELKSGVYQICNGEELKWFADKVNDGTIAANSNAKLVRSFYVNNITITDGQIENAETYRTFDPIGTTTVSYKGTFDGNGKTIFGLYYDRSGETTEMAAALIGNADGATVKDLTISKSYIKGDHYVSAICGSAKATSVTTPNTSTFRNCVVTDTLIVCTDQTTVYDKPLVELNELTGSYCGGIVGFGDHVEIENCGFSGTISSGNDGSAVGGIIGYVSTGVTVSGSYNSGTIEALRHAGGIAGEINATLVTDVTTITDCYNAGTVKGVATALTMPTDPTALNFMTPEEYQMGYGAIVGINISKINITDCYNDTTGKVSVSGTTPSGVGGILGVSMCSELDTVSNCANHGSVSAKNRVGGIAGATFDKIKFVSCKNIGEVKNANQSIGGIIGYTEKKVTLENCVTTTDSSVTGKRAAGGMIGENFANATVKNCVNNGSVTETVAQIEETDLNPHIGAGGIIGVAYKKAKVESCTNNGIVTSNYQGAGGIIGRVMTEEVTEMQPDPENPLLMIEVPVIHSAEGTSMLYCVNNGAVITVAFTVEEGATPTPTIAPTTTPSDAPAPTATPDILMGSMYTGGILGFANTDATINYSFNAGYVEGRTKVGGIAGIMKVPAASPTPTPDVTPSETPVPVYNIENCYSVGLVTATNATNEFGITDGSAGAILGTSAGIGSFTFNNNYFLVNSVVAPVTITKAGGVDLATEKTDAEFFDSTEAGVCATLNSTIVAAPGETPVPIFVMLPADVDVATGLDKNNYAYGEYMMTKLTEYNEAHATQAVVLPLKIPVFAA